MEIAGAAAPNATLIYVFAPSAWSAVLYAIDENLAPILSTSFGGCETTPSLWAPWICCAFSANRRMRRESHGCPARAIQARPHANRSSRILWVGARCLYTGQPSGGHRHRRDRILQGAGTYWDATGAALSYIPEIAWNDTAAVGRLWPQAAASVCSIRSPTGKMRLACRMTVRGMCPISRSRVLALSRRLPGGHPRHPKNIRRDLRHGAILRGRACASQSVSGEQRCAGQAWAGQHQSKLYELAS